VELVCRVLGCREDEDARRYPLEICRQVVELARAGTRVAQLATTFGMSEATIYNWLKQEKVRHACGTLGVSESGFYAWKTRPASPRTLRRIWLAGEITDIHKTSDGTYGAHRVTAELKYGRGIKVGHNAVELIMRQLGIRGCRSAESPRARGPARSPRWTWCVATSRVTPRQALDDRHHRTPDARGQDLLLRRARPLLGSRTRPGAGLAAQPRPKRAILCAPAPHRRADAGISRRDGRRRGLG